MTNNESGFDKTKKCPFCSKLKPLEHWEKGITFGMDVVVFNEHYYFCTDCSAIWTYPILQKSTCSHIKKHTPFVVREPWFKEAREKSIYVIEGDKRDFCSKCKNSVIMDGW